MRALILALLLLLPLTAALAADIHVAPAGSDGNDGSAAAPLATLAQALELASPGDTIFLAQGTYQGGLSVRAPRLTITSEPGDMAIITAPTDVEDLDACLYVKVEGAGLTLSRLELVGGFYYALMLESTWSSGEPVKRAAHDILIEQCRIHDSGRDCVKITPGADNVTIRRCEIFGSGRRDDSNAEGVDNVNGDNMVIEDTWLHDIATTGVYFKGGATGCVVERCVIERCGGLGVGVGFDTSPEWFDAEANPRFFESMDGVVRNCLIRNVAYAGIGIYASLNARAYNNTVLDAAREGQSPLFFGVAYHDWEEGVSRPGSVNPDVRGNIFALARGVDAAVVTIRYNDDLEGLSALEGNALLDANCYFDPDGPARFADLRPGNEYEGGFEGWRSHLGGDAASLEADPLLDADMNLAAGSPCREAGVPLPGVEADIHGIARGPRPSMGAAQ